MRDIQERMLLKEVVVKLGIDKSWINSLQRKTGIPKPIGTKGERTYFESNEIDQIKTANVLRFLGFSFNDIKRIYDAETAILKSPELQPKDDSSADSGGNKTSEFLFYTFKFPVNAYFKSADSNLQLLRSMYGKIRERQGMATRQIEMLSRKIAII